MRNGGWGLRSRRCFRVLAPAFWAASERFGFRVVHFAVMGNHIHLLVEAEGKTSLARGMQGLGVRIARGLNRLMGRRGRVLGDRYHARILRSPTEVKRVRAYQLTNAQRHYKIRHRDRYTSEAPLVEPRTYSVRRVC
jgi:REP-associated tyrosine transposase